MPARAGLDRVAVVQAAATLLDENAGEEITLAQLATRLGVRTPSLYNHIAGQEELHQELALLGVQELGRRMGRAAIGKAGAAAVRAMANAYRAFAHERPGLYGATLKAPDPARQQLRTASDEVVSIVAAVLEPYELSSDDTIHAIRGLRSVVEGFVSLERAGGFGLPVQVDESFAWLIELFLRGLEVGQVRSSGAEHGLSISAK